MSIATAAAAAAHVAAAAATAAAATRTPLRFLSQSVAQAIDVKLMSPVHGFSLEQLMELAGLSVAAAFAHRYPVARFGRVGVVCGPGNNGGDGVQIA